MKIRELEIAGSHFEMGYKHGFDYKDEIVKMAKERLALSSDQYWTGQELNEKEVLLLADACIDEHEKYNPDLLQELKGMAEATGLSIAELIIAGGFTDFIDIVYNSKDAKKHIKANHAADNCTAFLVPKTKSKSQNAYFGQTWDMHASASEFVVLLKAKPKNKPSFIVFTTVGCLGMIGLNSEGLAIGINNLSSTNGKIGVTWPFVVRDVLEQNSLDSALNSITRANLAGAHNYLIMDKYSNGYNIEAMPDKCIISKLEDEAIVHTNHCLVPETQNIERERTEESLISSTSRYKKASEILAKEKISLSDLKELTREPSSICTISKPPSHVETCGAAIIEPAKGKFWALWGLPSENEFEEFKIVNI